MMRRYLSPTTAQQAPMPAAARQASVLGAPSVLAGTDQTAWTSAHSTKRKPHHAMRAARTTVMMVEPWELNRLTRAQPSGPAPAESGGGRLAMGAAGMPAREETGSRGGFAELGGGGLGHGLALHERDARVVPVHEGADGQREGEIRRS